MSDRKYLNDAEIFKAGNLMKERWPDYETKRMTFTEIAEDISKELKTRVNASRVRRMAESFELPPFTRRGTVRKGKIHHNTRFIADTLADVCSMLNTIHGETSTNSKSIPSETIENLVTIAKGKPINV